MDKTRTTRAVIACTAATFIAQVAFFPALARADAPAAAPSAIPPSPALSPSTGVAPIGATPPAPVPAHGLAVVAQTGAEDAAWSLAKLLYARDTLRPSGLDEARARVLAGSAPTADAPHAVRDLADERAGIHGDDGASRALLRTIASQLNVRGLVLVDVSTPPSVRVYLTDTDSFDAARYAPDSDTTILDAGTPGTSDASSEAGMDAAAVAPSTPARAPLQWSGAVASLERAYASPLLTSPPPTPTSAPSLAWSQLPPKAPAQDTSHPFYASPWFWAAIGAAAFGGTAVYFATRDSTPSTVHLELQVR